MGEIKLIVKPDEEEPEAAEIYVDGKIDGREYRFLLDTGAGSSHVILDEYTATFDTMGRSHSSGVFAPKSDDLITVPSIEIGSISSQNFTLTRGGAALSGKSNLIGMDLLKDYCCHFRFDDSLLVADTTSPQADAFTFNPIRFDEKFHPYIDIQFGDAHANAVWDSGASITVADLNFINRQPSFFAEVGQSTGTDSTGTSVETPMFVMTGAVIGGRAFPPHKVAGVDLSQVNATLTIPMNLIAGYSTYRMANWLFDFPGKRWAISKWLDVP